MSLKFYSLTLALLVFIALTASTTVTNAISSAQPDAQVPSALTLKPDAAVMTWTGSNDNRWSNPRNWDSGRVPGPSDVARFTRGFNAEVEIDSKAIGSIGAMVVDVNFHGTIVLGRDFTIASSLLLQSGNFRQGDHDLVVNNYRQDGGNFEGGKANLVIEQRAVVNGGTFLTSKQMVASSLTIGSSAVVTTSANSKLNLTGDGTPLNGDGVLDVTTNGPASVEYTGKANTDITTAIPLRGTLSAGAIKSSQIMTELQAARSQPALLPMANTLSRSGALTLTAKEDHPFAAVIDTVNGFAYFGTLTTPGIVVKVRLSDFTRVGALVLNADEQDLRCATIDVTNGFAYFGGLNGTLVKIRLSDFTRVDSLNVGGPLAAAVIDSANGFAYFGALTGPAAVVKLRLSDFTVDDILVLNDGEDGILSAVIDTANGFAYFGTDNSPGIVVKVRLSDFTRVAAVTLNFSEEELTCAVIDTANGFAYFGGFSLFFAVAKIRLSDFTRVGGIFENTGTSFFRSAVMDNNGFAYFGNDEGNIFKVRLSDLSHVSTLNIPQIRSELNCAVIDTANGFAYFGHGIRPGVVKIRLSDFTEASNVAFSRGENNLGAAVIDTTTGFAYFGTGGQPGLIIKLRLSNFTIVGVLALDDTPESSEYSFRSAVIDTTNGFAYFGSDTSPGTIVKVRLSDFTRVGALKLNAGEDSLFSAVIDTTNGFAYFAAVPTSKGKIIKIRLSDFSRVGALTLNDSERGFCAVIDPGNDFAYFGAPTLPGTVVKVRLSDLSRIGTLTITDEALSAVIDTANGFAYFGGSAGIVSRVRLSDFSTAGEVTSGTSGLHTGVIDPAKGFAYFGTFDSPAKVVQIRLSPFTQGDTLTLNPGEDLLISAVIDAANSSAYFGTLTQPAKIVKVTLADAAPTPTPTPSPSPTPTPGPPVLLLEESGPVADLAAALDSVLLLRDPFPVVNGLDLLNIGTDRNTRVIVFVSNLQLLPGETASSTVVNLVDSNSQSFDLTAEDVRAISNTTFTQVVFRLPDNVAIGTCTIRIKVHEQMSNPGTIRIRL